MFDLQVTVKLPQSLRASLPQDPEALRRYPNALPERVFSLGAGTVVQFTYAVDTVDTVGGPTVNVISACLHLIESDGTVKADATFAVDMDAAVQVLGGRDLLDRLAWLAKGATGWPAKVLRQGVDAFTDEPGYEYDLQVVQAELARRPQNVKDGAELSK
ncbi:hypothetical protein ACFQ1S_02050 [Kibdelosporangium lantanae]|uniref:Uncharacterized protein n=1 Tax=Kibdelosporangium lantanae TaxID=1497396 RepID=A0ABW3M2D8_9PSEU